VSEENVKKLVAIINQQPEKRVSLKLVVPNEYNKNKMDAARFELLLESLKTFKQVYPIIVRRLEDGTLSIIDGEHRWKGLCELKEEEVICKIVDFTEAEARLFTIHINKMRGKTSEVGERQVIEPIRAQLPYLDVSALSMLPPLTSPAPIGAISTVLPEAPSIDLGTAVSPEPSLAGQKETEDSPALTERIGQSYESTVTAENTVAIPLFFKQSEYEHVMALTMKVKEKYKLASREEAFIMLAKIGEESEQHREENKRLKEKIDKIEAEREVASKNREEKKQERIIAQLKKDAEKAGKEEERARIKEAKLKEKEEKAKAKAEAARIKKEQKSVTSKEKKTKKQGVLKVVR